MDNKLLYFEIYAIRKVGTHDLFLKQSYWMFCKGNTFLNLSDTQTAKALLETFIQLVIHFESSISSLL